VSRTNLERIRDILESIEAIDRAQATVQRYQGDSDVAQLALDAVQRRVFTIGEAVKALSRDLRERHPEVPWSDIARMRDLIGHHYYKLDSEIVRATIGEPVEALRVVCHAILAESDEMDVVVEEP
jgi:uncharacterized protein with HEPN domain